MTRLRFTLKDESLLNKKNVEEISGVMGTMLQNGQFQVIIGQNVPDVYDEICKLSGIVKKKKQLMKIWTRI